MNSSVYTPDKDYSQLWAEYQLMKDLADDSPYCAQRLKEMRAEIIADAKEIVMEWWYQKVNTIVDQLEEKNTLMPQMICHGLEGDDTILSEITLKVIDPHTHKVAYWVRIADDIRAAFKDILTPDGYLRIIDFDDQRYEFTW